MNDLYLSLGTAAASLTLALPLSLKISKKLEGLKGLLVGEALVLGLTCCFFVTFNVTMSFHFAAPLMAKNNLRGEYRTTLIIGFNESIERGEENAKVAGETHASAWYTPMADEVHISVMDLILSPTILAHEFAHAIDRNQRMDEPYWSDGDGSAGSSIRERANPAGLAKLSTRTRGYSAQNNRETLACLYQEWVLLPKGIFEAEYGSNAVLWMQYLEER